MSRGRPPLKPVYVEGVPYWQCAACGDYRPRARFSLMGAKANGLHSYCKECQSARNRKDYVTLRIKGLRAEIERLEAER